MADWTNGEIPTNKYSLKLLCQTSAAPEQHQIVSRKTRARADERPVHRRWRCNHTGPVVRVAWRRVRNAARVLHDLPLLQCTLLLKLFVGRLLPLHEDYCVSQSSERIGWRIEQTAAVRRTARQPFLHMHMSLSSYSYSCMLRAARVRVYARKSRQRCHRIIYSEPFVRCVLFNRKKKKKTNKKPKEKEEVLQ